MSLIAVLALSSAVAGCSTADDEAEVVEAPAIAPPSASAYTLAVVNEGDEPRFGLITPVPVGRTASVTVSLTSLDESIDVFLEATVVKAGADGASQLIELVITGADADDPSTIDGLTPILGASSSLVRDERSSLVEQTLDVPAGLAFRADAVARQALRAPFVLAGPLPLEPVGAGASWTVESVDEGSVIAATVVEVVSVSATGYRLRFDVPDGAVEIVGSAGSLLPDEQVITLENATLIVVAERSN